MHIHGAIIHRVNSTCHRDDKAGGRPQPTALGDARINSSLGSQWAKKGPNSQQTQSEQLQKAAERAKAQGKDTVNVTLEECEE